MERIKVTDMGVSDNSMDLSTQDSCIVSHIVTGEKIQTSKFIISNSTNDLSNSINSEQTNQGNVACEQTLSNELKIQSTGMEEGNKRNIPNQMSIQVVVDESGNVKTLSPSANLQLVNLNGTVGIVLYTSESQSATPEGNQVDIMDHVASKVLGDANESQGTESKECGTMHLVEKNDIQDNLMQPQGKPFVCDLCSASFTRFGNFTRHRMIHTIHINDDYRYKCEICDRMFLQRCDLTRHMLVHEGSQPFKCETCGKGYIRKSDLVVHKRFHNNERLFKCSQCSKAFFQSGDLLRHQRLVHQKLPRLTCGHCKRKYSKEATLIRHMQTAHRDLILDSLGTGISSSPGNSSMDAKDMIEMTLATADALEKGQLLHS